MSLIKSRAVENYQPPPKLIDNNLRLLIQMTLSLFRQEKERVRFS